MNDAAAHGVAQHGFVVGDGHPHADAGTLVDFAAVAGLGGDLGHNPFHIVGNHQPVFIGESIPFLVHYGDFVPRIQGIVGVDLRAVAVFQRRYDAAPVGVILRVGRRHHIDVQRQPDAVALDLHIPLFHQVEQPHLNPLGQVGQFVDAEDAPVGARHQPIVNRQLVRQIMPFRHLDGVDFANQVGDGNVGRRQLFRVALFPRQPLDGRIVALFGHPVVAGAADGGVGVAVDFAAGHFGDGLVQQIDHTADEPRFGLPPLAQQNDILPGQDGVFQLGNHRLLKADDAGEDDFFGADFGDEVMADFLADGPGLVAAFPQGADGGRAAGGVGGGMAGGGRFGHRSSS